MRFSTLFFLDFFELLKEFFLLRLFIMLSKSEPWLKLYNVLRDTGWLTNRTSKPWGGEFRFDARTQSPCVSLNPRCPSSVLLTRRPLIQLATNTVQVRCNYRAPPPYRRIFFFLRHEILRFTYERTYVAMSVYDNFRNRLIDVDDFVFFFFCKCALNSPT